jgi:hypothetical protein
MSTRGTAAELLRKLVIWGVLRVTRWRLGSILCWRPDGAVLVTSKCLAQIRLDTVSARSAP